MKWKWKRICLLVLTAITALLVWGGCSFGVTKDQILEENGLSVRVTYHANGGLFENNTNIKDVYYPAGNPAAPIGLVDITNAKIKKDGYELEGWYFVATDKDGNLVYENEQAELFKLGEKVDFSKPLEKGKDWVICANWLVLTKVKVKLSVFNTVQELDRAAEVENAAGGTYKTGDEVGAFNYQNGVVNTATLAPFEAKNKSYTFVQYYSDEACTKNVEWPIARDEENDVYIYVKYIAGNWKTLKTSNDVWNMFYDSTFTGEGYYLLNDIAYTDGAIESLWIKGFNHRLYGNGYKISGLEIEQSASVNLFNQYGAVSLFGALGENAEIKDVTLENLSVNFKLTGSGQMAAYYLFSSVTAQTKVQNLSASGTFKITKQASVALQADFETAWQYGGSGKNLQNIVVTAEKL
jgi:hypothetical protein